MTMVMIMAGGTGGHVMPALAVAEQLRQRGLDIRWMGNADSMEARVADSASIDFDVIRIKGLRQSGLRRKLVMPFLLLGACYQAWRGIKRHKPDLLLGMGGFVSGPGGLVARLGGTPLILHEQNAVAGMTNRYLARLARRVLCGFPETLGIADTEFVGNPVRSDIAAIEPPEQRLGSRRSGLRVLVVGGSQGAGVFNRYLPALLAGTDIPAMEVWHQCGREHQAEVEEEYHSLDLKARVSEFIDDMAAAYSWSDVIICRAGAMTVAEVSAAGAVALFVPYPHAVNDHQARNAEWLVNASAGLMYSQQAFTRGEFIPRLRQFAGDRSQLIAMANKARAMAITDATTRVADICQEVIDA